MWSLFLAAFGLILTLQCLFVDGMINNFNTVSTSIFTQIISESFGMSDQGQIDVSYSIGPKVNVPFPSSPLLIVIINEGQKNGYYANLSPNSCNLPSLFREVVYGSGNITYYTSGADLYSVLIMQCRNGNPLSPVSANVQVTMKNPKPTGSGYQYLPINIVSYISILEGLIICYCILIGALMFQMLFAYRYVRTVHMWYGAALFLVLLSVVARYVQNVYQNNTGNVGSNSYQYFVQLTNFFSTMANLTLLVLISLGWSILRAFISQREKEILGVSLLIYFALGLAAGSCINNGNVCSGLTLGAYVFKYVLYLIIVVAMNLTVTQLRIVLNHIQWAPQLAYQYTRVKQFQTFRFTFIIYLLLPTAFLLIEALIFNWKETWVNLALLDILDLCLFFFIGASFGPIDELLLSRPLGGVRMLQPRS